MTPPRPPTDAGPNTGARGEDFAAAHLRAAGYRVVARDLRTVDAEIDLLVRRRRLWIAVEVKTRRGHPAPERAVAPRQIERIVRALGRLAPRLRPRPRELRVDVVAVRLQRGAAAEVAHFPGTPFEPPSAR